MLLGLIYLLLFIGYLIILTFSIVRLIKGYLSKNKFHIKQGACFVLLLVGLPLLLKLWTFVIRPSSSDLVGSYVLVKSHSGIAETDYSKYILELTKDGTFTLSNTDSLELCNDGYYNLDYRFTANELAFKCGSSHELASIKQGLTGYQIGLGFAYDIRSDYFEKIE